MSVKPILFNTEMVRAMLEGRKTISVSKITKITRQRLSAIRLQN